MNLFFVPCIYWYFHANLFFIIGMTGYLTMDVIDYAITVNATTTYIVYVILSSIFVIDAIIHFLIWQSDPLCESKMYNGISCSAWIFDNIGSFSYLLGALFSYNIETSLQIVRIFNLIGVCGFLLEAIASFIAWRIITKMNTKNAKINAWANSFNLLGSILYLVATNLLFGSKGQHLTQIAGDAIYFIDSILYMCCWYREKRSLERNKLELNNSDVDIPIVGNDLT